MLKLDIFPQPYFERMKKIADGNPALAAQLKRWLDDSIARHWPALRP